MCNILLKKDARNEKYRCSMHEVSKGVLGSQTYSGTKF